MLGAPDNFNASLARSLTEADIRAVSRERAKSRRTTLRTGAADRRQPNDFIGILRAARNPTIWSRGVGRGAHGAAREALEGENGTAHKRR
jgi:hypothetical protein